MRTKTKETRRQDVTWKSEPDVIPNQEEYREDN